MSFGFNFSLEFPAFVTRFTGMYDVPSLIG